MDNSEKKQCPYCGKEILSIAKKCKFCGNWFETASEKNTEKLKDSIVIEKETNNINLKPIIITIIICLYVYAVYLLCRGIMETEPILMFSLLVILTALAIINLFLPDNSKNKKTINDNNTYGIIFAILIFFIILNFLFNSSAESLIISGCEYGGGYYSELLGMYRKTYYCKNKPWDEVKILGIDGDYEPPNYTVRKKITSKEGIFKSLSLESIGGFSYKNGNYYCSYADDGYGYIGSNKYDNLDKKFKCTGYDFIKYMEKSIQYDIDMLEYTISYLKKHPKELSYLQKKRWQRSYMPLWEYRKYNLGKKDLDNYNGKETFDNMIKKYPITNMKK